MSDETKTSEQSAIEADAEDIGLRFWRQDFGDGRYLYFSRLMDGGLYVEIRTGPAMLEARTTDSGAESILQWLDRSRDVPMGLSERIEALSSNEREDA